MRSWSGAPYARVQHPRSECNIDIYYQKVRPQDEARCVGGVVQYDEITDLKISGEGGQVS